jgi:hypothetical protein
MRQLARSGCFRDLHSVIDLGPQDVQLERPVLERGVRDITPAERLDPLLDAIYVDGRVARDAQTPFYELFGLGPYASIDVEDDRATYRLDLNRPAKGLPSSMWSPISAPPSTSSMSARRSSRSTI